MGGALGRLGLADLVVDGIGWEVVVAGSRTRREGVGVESVGCVEDAACLGVACDVRARSGDTGGHGFLGVDSASGGFLTAMFNRDLRAGWGTIAGSRWRRGVLARPGSGELGDLGAGTGRSGEETIGGGAEAENNGTTGRVGGEVLGGEGCVAALGLVLRV